MRRDGQRGIYVECLIRGTMDEVWRLTQSPEVHQRWDMRFTVIQYLPKTTELEPQRFLYKTRIGPGLTVSGTGESVGERFLSDGSASSALKFASNDLKSLVTEGAGYWRYIPVAEGVCFLTWYDYRVRYGWLGNIVDRFIFRPLMGWATAWSFDRLRLWVEEGQTPEVSIMLAAIHAIARVSIAGIWIWHGVVPKLLFSNLDERLMLMQSGVSLSLLPWIGGGEIVFGVVMLLGWRWRGLFIANLMVMAAALATVAVMSPQYLRGAFNPVMLNLASMALSLVGFLSETKIPSARWCLRRKRKENVEVADAVDL